MGICIYTTTQKSQEFYTLTPAVYFQRYPPHIIVVETAKERCANALE